MAMRSIFLSFLLAIAASAASRAAELQTADPVLAEASGLAGLVMFVNSGAPGMVLVIVRGGRSLVLGYGETEKGNKHTPDGNSLFRLNSITKVFATELLVSLAAEGKLSITDPLQHYAGKTKVPAFGTRPITLLDLATYSAALPREMGDAPEGVFSRAWPTREDRWKWLPSYKLPGHPAPSPTIPMSASIFWPTPSKQPVAKPIPVCCASASRHHWAWRTPASRQRPSNAPG